MFRSFFICSGLLVVLLAGCGSRTEVASNPSQQEIETFRSPLALEEDELAFEASRLLQMGAYDILEQRIAGYRRTGETFLDGRAKLFLFYQGLSWSARDEEQWQQQQRQIKAWHKDKPQSLAAPIALAYSYCRGNAIARRVWSSQMPDVENRHARERLKLARETLEKVKSSRKQCADWFNVATYAYGFSGDELKTYKRYADEADALYPDWFHLKLNRVITSVLTATGQPDWWTNYVAEAADKAKGEKGDLLYARIIWELARLQTDSADAALATNYDWPRAKRGFQLLIEHPDLETDSVAAAFAKAAWFQNDHDTAHKLFQRSIKNRADRSVWSGPEEFTAARDWALG